MRKGCLLAIAVCVLGGLTMIGATGAAAQETGQAPPPPPQGQHQGRVDRELQRMTENLNLTADQQAKIRPILEDQAKQLRALRADSTIPEADARAKSREIRRSTRKQIDEILTPEQREKQKAMHQEMRGKHGGPPPQPPQNQ